MCMDFFFQYDDIPQGFEQYLKNPFVYLDSDSELSLSIFGHNGVQCVGYGIMGNGYEICHHPLPPPTQSGRLSRQK